MNQIMYENIWAQNSHRRCKKTMKEKTLLLRKFVCLQMHEKRLNGNFNSNIIGVINNLRSSEGAVSHNILHYQKLSVARYQVRLSASI